MYCPECGFKADDKALFCPDCGFELKTVRKALVKEKLPLHNAVALDDYLKVSNLLKGGEDPNRYNQKGKTPLHLAAEARNQRLMQLLIDKGADPKLPDYNGQTAADIFKMGSNRSSVPRTGAVPSRKPSSSGKGRGKKVIWKEGVGLWGLIIFTIYAVVPFIVNIGLRADHIMYWFYGGLFVFAVVTESKDRQRNIFYRWGRYFLCGVGYIILYTIIVAATVMIATPENVGMVPKNIYLVMWFAGFVSSIPFLLLHFWYSTLFTEEV